MNNRYCKLTVTQSTKNLLNYECRALFLKKNPDFEGMRLTEEFLVLRIIKSYLDKLWRWINNVGSS